MKIPSKLKKKLTKTNLRIIGLIAFALVGTILIFRTLASVPNQSIEAESATLTGGATKVSDNAASDGEYVAFGGTVTPPPPTSYVPPIGLPNIEIPSNAKFVSPDGNDSNPGTDAQPWRNVSQAVAKLNPGDTLVIKAGTYTMTAADSVVDPYDVESRGFLNIYGKNGSENSWIKIVGDPRGARPKIYAPWDGASWQTLYIRNSSYVWAQYLELSSDVFQQQGKVTGVYIWGSNNVRIYDVWANNGGGCGICTNESNHVNIRGNLIWSNSRWNEYNTSGYSQIGVTTAGGPVNADGYSNYFVGNMLWDNEALVTFVAAPQWGITDGNCIIMDVSGNAGARTLIANNICVDNGGKCLHAVRYVNADYFNNTCYHNLRSDAYSVGGSSELTAQDSSGIRFRDNFVWPRPSKSSKWIDNYSGADVSGNAWVGGNPGGGSQVDGSTLASPNISNPPQGNWSISGTAAGKGAPWPLKTTYPN